MKIEHNTKEFIQFISSLLVLIAGVALVFISLFIPPQGEIDPSVLGAFGMFLGFVGAVWNIDIKYTYKTRELTQRFTNDEMGGPDEPLT